MELIFIHVPKTGGASTNTALKSAGVLKQGYGFNHQTAKELDLSHDVPVIATVRNPYDRIWSIYEFFSKKRSDIPKNISFEKFVTDFEKTFYKKKPMFYTCHDFLYVDGICKATEILKFENINDDYKELCKKYMFRNDLKHLNINDSKTSCPGFTQEMKEIIDRIFHHDFVEFGYIKEIPVHLNNNVDRRT